MTIDPSILKALGAHGSAATAPVLLGYMLFTPIGTHDLLEQQYARHVAENARSYILDVVEQARGVEDPEFKASLCRTLEEAIAELCASAPSDSICVDRAKYLERAGC